MPWEFVVGGFDGRFLLLREISGSSSFCLRLLGSGDFDLRNSSSIC